MAALTIASTLICPHGGQVQIVSANTRVLAGAAPLVTAGDAFPILGCPFTLPGPAPSPCVVVEWVSPDKKSRLTGGQTLSTTSVGLCKAATGAPQGPVIVAATQPRASTL